jgi:hypothetical protein
LLHGIDMTWLLLHMLCRVTAYALQDDALSTGELDYINGGKCLMR